MRMLTLLGGLAIAACLSGCSTIYTLASGIREPWSGSQLDVYVLTSSDSSLLLAAGAALDYPFSLVGDAAVLMFTKPGSVEPFAVPDPR